MSSCVRIFGPIIALNSCAHTRSHPAGYGAFLKFAVPYLIVLYAFNAALICAYTALDFTA